jgi:hypothetical protein
MKINDNLTADFFFEEVEKTHRLCGKACFYAYIS